MALFTEFDDESAPQALTATLLQIAEPWYAYLIGLPNLPLPNENRRHLHESLQRLVRTVSDQLSCRQSVFLQMDELHQDGSIRNVSRYGRQWCPTMGLGVRPETASPRYWTSDDLLERDYKEPIPALMHGILHLDTDIVGLAHAIQTMTGTGGLLQILHSTESGNVLSTWYGVLQPSIKEEGASGLSTLCPIGRCCGSARFVSGITQSTVR